MKNQLVLSAIFCLSFLSNGIAQINFNGREDFKFSSYAETGLSDKAQMILPLDDGQVLCYQRGDKESGSRTWYHQLYDANMSLLKTKEIHINKKYTEYIVGYSNRNYVKLLDVSKAELIIMNVDAATLDADFITVARPKKFDPQHIATNGENAFILGKSKNGLEVMVLNLQSKKQQTFPISAPVEKPSKLHYKNFQYLPESGEIICFIGDYILDGGPLFFTLIDKNGASPALSVSKSRSVKPNSAIASTDGKGNYYISGSFFTTPVKTKQRKTHIFQEFFDDGIYLSKINNGKVVYTKSYKTSMLKNLSATIVGEEKPTKGGRVLSALMGQYDYICSSKEYLLHLLPPKITADGIYIGGQSAYPRIHKESVPGGNSSNTTYTTVFDGYNYNSAFVVKFGQNGIMEWNYASEISMGYDKRKDFPDEKVRYMDFNIAENGRIDIAYPKDHGLALQSLKPDGSENGEELLVTIPMPNNQSECEKSDARIAHIQGNKFVIHGYQSFTRLNTNYYIQGFQLAE